MDQEEDLRRKLRAMLNGDTDVLRKKRRFYHYLPSAPRCKSCNAPFRGVGSWLLHLFTGQEQSTRAPNYCTACEMAFDSISGGVEVEMAMLFADVRGATQMAEGMSNEEFRELINRFFVSATEILPRYDAFLDKFVGDEVIAFFIPGLAGPEYASRAVRAARDLQQETARSEGPDLPIGIGVHSGPVYFGNVGSEDGFSELTALGDDVNVAARLASVSDEGEILVTNETVQKIEGWKGTGDTRELRLKGKETPVTVHSLRLGTDVG